MIAGAINTILAPSFLTNNIGLISLMLGATILVIFSDFVNKNFVFPFADYIKSKSHTSIKKSKTHQKAPWSTKILSESLATIIFLLYCYLGASFLAEYIFAPILGNLRQIILLVVIGLFFLISYIINNKTIRNKFIKV